ncbi:mas-related G-protein coupled receptor member H-like isoform X2 [Pleurodeles waltl]|uniref:mas-related G-protein coupled receptor member H-like isoform X2 n=1 Tax=Pleurodeles waltl TaxID=8319 RepID=UPI0037095EC3
MERKRNTRTLVGQKRRVDPRGPKMEDHFTATQIPAEMEDDDYYSIFNITEPDSSHLDSTTLAALSIPLAISFFGLIWNGMVIWFLWFRMVRNAFATYILNLAISDFKFLLILCIVCQLVLIDLHGQISEGLSYDILIVMSLFGYQNSHCFLAAISVERSLSVLYPIWYRCRRSNHHSTVVCIILWIFSCVMVGIDILACVQHSKCKEITIVQSVIYLWIFLPLILLSNVILIITIWKSSQRRHTLRPYILIFATVLAFLILSAPFSLMIFLEVLDIVNMETSLMIIFIQCFCINSCINPIIYFLVGNLRHPGCKSTLGGALHRAFHEEPGTSQNEESGSLQRQSLRISSSL